MEDVVVTYLELDLRTPTLAAPHAVPLQFELEHIASAAAGDIAALMYRAVGAPWHWTDRLSWSETDWDKAVNREDVELWVARVDHEIVGYFELHLGKDAIELKYFGLMPEYTGRRIGGALLSAAIDRVRILGRTRMTVNTCTLDHPGALPNYLKRGFTVLRTEEQRRDLTP